MVFILKNVSSILLCICQTRGTLWQTSEFVPRQRCFSSEKDDQIFKYLKQAFAQADTNKDGLASLEEIKKVIKLFFAAKGTPENPLVFTITEKLIFQDKTNLSQEEFLNRIKNTASGLKSVGKEILKIKFMRHDNDKDGKLNKEETSKLLEELYPFTHKGDVDLVFSKYNKSQDGNLTVVEFLEFAKKEILSVKI